jgi:hypothetical protein
VIPQRYYYKCLISWFMYFSTPSFLINEQSLFLFFHWSNLFSWLMGDKFIWYYGRFYCCGLIIYNWNNL